MVTGVHSIVEDDGLPYFRGMSNELKDKVALVTGGARGIGYAIAEAMLAEGARVFICGRDASTVKGSIAKLSMTSRDRVDGAAANVRRYDDCRTVVARAAERFGGLDILVNNAGIGIFKPVDQLTPEDWAATIETNLSGAFYCSRESIPHMRRRGGGYIVNISSLAAVNTFPGGSAYNASKFGLNGFTEAMMQDVRYDGIRVSTIMPGSVATDFGGDPGTKQKEAWKLSAEDIARAVVDLVSFPRGSLASRIELRPSQPPRK
jgi:3-oxoacyl-[acyl-carrier protein] reductase